MSKLNHFLEEEKDFQKMFNQWKNKNNISHNDSNNLIIFYNLFY